MKKCVGYIALIMALIGGALWVCRKATPQALSPTSMERGREGHLKARTPQHGRTASKRPNPKKEAVSRVVSTTESDEEAVAEQQMPLTDEEKREAEEEKLVDAFDALTDAWMEPKAKGVSMEDVQKFVSQFKKVPKARKDECLHRALNLIPDENIMLLAGILMDKSQDKDMLELVYSDVLNRNEEVKKPILQQIFKDKEHPCWADTAWILDVTGELPGKKQ